jgi:hypothetical protein
MDHTLPSSLLKAIPFAPMSRGNRVGGQKLQSPFEEGSESHFILLHKICKIM